MDFKHWLVESTVENGYHVTYEKYIHSIQQEGLIPGGHGSNWELDKHVNHSKRGVFFSTKEEAVRYWMSLYRLAFDQSDEDAIIGGDIPILLRFRLNVKKRKKDIHGLEAGDSWYYPKEIPPQGIQYWDGKKWNWLKDYKSLDLDLYTAKPENPDPNKPLDWQRQFKLSSEFPYPKFS